MKITGFHVFIGTVTLAVAAAVITGFVIIGSPSAERTRRFDQQRVNDIQQISYAVDAYWTQVKALPPSLGSLMSNNFYYVSNINDPLSKQPYEYRIVSTSTYELCATFESDSTKASGAQKDMAMYAPYPSNMEIFLKHGTGRVCAVFHVNQFNKVAN